LPEAFTSLPFTQSATKLSGNGFILDHLHPL